MWNKPWESNFAFLVTCSRHVVHLGSCGWSLAGMVAERGHVSGLGQLSKAKPWASRTPCAHGQGCTRTFPVTPHQSRQLWGLRSQDPVSLRLLFCRNATQCTQLQSPDGSCSHAKTSVWPGETRRTAASQPGLGPQPGSTGRRAVRGMFASRGGNSPCAQSPGLICPRYTTTG